MKQSYRVGMLSWLAAGLLVLAGSGSVLGQPATVALAQMASGSWSERSPMLLPRSEASVAELNGKVYFMGGYPGARITSDSVQVYTPASDSWELGPPLPIPLHHTMASVANGRLYIMGGEAGNPTAGESVFQSGVYMLDEQAG